LPARELCTSAVPKELFEAQTLWLSRGEKETKVQYLRLTVLIGLIIAVSGCGISRQTESNSTRNKLMHLEIGMERDSVLSLMGNPYTREGYGDNEYLFYETNHWANDERKRFTPILLQKGKVIGWGQKYYYDSGERKKTGGIRALVP
jgi:hypothetical protein